MFLVRSSRGSNIARSAILRCSPSRYLHKDMKTEPVTEGRNEEKDGNAVDRLRLHVTLDALVKSIVWSRLRDAVGPPSLSHSMAH